MGSNRKRSNGRFIGIPYNVAISRQFAALRAPEVKLLIDLLTQYNGHNNGKLSTTISLLKDRGWATASLYRARANLVEKGFLVITRQGWKQRGRPTLVAISWNGIDDCGVVYDDGVSPSQIPLAYWCKAQSVWR